MTRSKMIGLRWADEDKKKRPQKNNPPLLNQLLDLGDYWAAANAAA